MHCKRMGSNARKSSLACTERPSEKRHVSFGNALAIRKSCRTMRTPKNTCISRPFCRFERLLPSPPTCTTSRNAKASANAECLMPDAQCPLPTQATRRHTAISEAKRKTRLRFSSEACQFLRALSKKLTCVRVSTFAIRRDGDGQPRDHRGP